MNNKNLTGGELTDAPNDQYQKFFKKFAEIDTLNVADWKPVHILAYFCKKYEEIYNVSYKFKFNSPSPGKSFEIFQIKKLASLLTAQPNLLRDYIDWIFLNKVVKAKRRLTSISFMTHEGIIQEYKVNVLLAGKKPINVNRSSLLPEIFLKVFVDANLPIKTYGDLAFTMQMDPMPENVSVAVDQIVTLGFDKEIISKIV